MAANNIFGYLALHGQIYPVLKLEILFPLCLALKSTPFTYVNTIMTNETFQGLTIAFTQI